MLDYSFLYTYAKQNLIVYNNSFANANTIMSL